MGSYDNAIAKLRSDLELLKNKQVVFNYEPINPTANTIWADPATQTTKFFDWKNWFTTSWGSLSNFTITSVITASDYNTITWTSWVINIGTSTWSVQYAISSGSFDMTTQTYFYWQDDIPTAIQTTTDAWIAVTNWGIIIAISKPNTDTANKAWIKILWTLWDLIISDNIVANSITANMLQANSVTASKISVTSLSAINANLWSITAWNMTIDSSGYIKWGQVAYDTWTWFFLWNSSWAYKLSIGNSAWNKLTWDSSTLSIVWTLNTWSWSNINASYITNVSALSIGSLSWNLDNISNWSTYVKTTSNEKTWAGRWYNALNSSNRYAQWLTTNDFVSGTNPSTGIVMDSAGIRWYYGSDKKFEVKTSDWSAFFKWDIYAVNWTFTGSITSSATITWWTIKTSNTYWYVELSDQSWLWMLQFRSTFENEIHWRIFIQDYSWVYDYLYIDWSWPYSWWSGIIMNWNTIFNDSTDVYWTVNCEYRLKIPVWSNLY